MYRYFTAARDDLETLRSLSVVFATLPQVHKWVLKKHVANKLACVPCLSRVLKRRGEHSDGHAFDLMKSAIFLCSCHLILSHYAPMYYMEDDCHLSHCCDSHAHIGKWLFSIKQDERTKNNHVNWCPHQLNLWEHNIMKGAVCSVFVQWYILNEGLTVLTRLFNFQASGNYFGKTKLFLGWNKLFCCGWNDSPPRSVFW